MVDRASGRASWTLDPYQVSVSFGGRQTPSDQSWFGPLSPIAPAAPADVAGRQWDYPSGYNLSLHPRPYEPVSFATLRQARRRLRPAAPRDRDAEGSGLAHGLVDQAAWSNPRPRPHRRRDIVLHVPRRHSRLERLAAHVARGALRDRRAGALLPSRQGRSSDRPAALDGSTIKPVIDAWGRTPQAYQDGGATIWPTAYQQVLKGFPAVDYAARDLLYRPRNPRVNRAYGFSPVEQIVTTVNIALRRQLF